MHYIRVANENDGHYKIKRSNLLRKILKDLKLDMPDAGVSYIA